MEVYFNWDIIVLFYSATTCTDIPLTTMRSVIAKRLAQSKQGSPHGYATAESNIDAISKIRKDFLNSGKIELIRYYLVVDNVLTKD